MPLGKSQVVTPSGVRPTAGYGVNEYGSAGFVGWMRAALSTVAECRQRRISLRESALPRLSRVGGHGVPTLQGYLATPLQAKPTRHLAHVNRKRHLKRAFVPFTSVLFWIDLYVDPFCRKLNRYVFANCFRDVNRLVAVVSVHHTDHRQAKVNVRRGVVNANFHRSTVVRKHGKLAFATLSFRKPVSRRGFGQYDHEAIVGHALSVYSDLNLCGDSSAPTQENEHEVEHDNRESCR